jgi:hypothetical protein
MERAGALQTLSPWSQPMQKKLTLDLDSLGVETFATAPDLAKTEAEFILRPSRQSCIEQCTTSCVP